MSVHVVSIEAEGDGDGRVYEQATCTCGWTTGWVNSPWGRKYGKEHETSVETRGDPG